MGLHEEAKNGRLTADMIRDQFGRDHVDEIDPGSELTPLILAVIGGHVTVIKALIECDVDVNKQSEDGRTPLFWATFNKKYPNHVEVVRALLSHPKIVVDATSIKVQKVTPLQNAITRLKDPEVISLLVDNHASTDLPNARRETARQLAAKSQNQKITRALLPKEQRNAPSHETVNRVVETVAYFFGLGARDEGDKEAQDDVKQVCNMNRIVT
jgi:ankyrin repeat protein